MRTKKKKIIIITAGPCCRCDVEKIILQYDELPSQLKKVFKSNNRSEVSHYLKCPKCFNYTAMPKDGEFWF